MVAVLSPSNNRGRNAGLIISPQHLITLMTAVMATVMLLLLFYTFVVGSMLKKQQLSHLIQSAPADMSNGAEQQVLPPPPPLRSGGFLASTATVISGSNNSKSIEIDTKIQNASIEAWSSSLEVDCNSFSDDPAGETYKETSTEPSFTMNLHPPSRDDVSRSIWEVGCWECDHIKAVQKALSHYHNSYFLDIGGNIGMWSLSAAAAHYQTITIEALPDNYRRFCLSVSRNKFHNRTHLLNIAATEKPATFGFDIHRGNFGGTNVVPIDESKATNNLDDTKIVQGVPIDSLNLPTNQPVVLKLDVEGHELSVLSGATQFLNNANIVYAMMELRPGLGNDPKWKSIFKVLHSKGLRPYRINYEDETALDINRLNEWKHFKHPIVRYYDVAWRLSDFSP